MRVEVSIGALVLEGVALDAAGRRAFEAALREAVLREGRFEGAIVARVAAAPVAAGDGFGRGLGGSLGAALGRDGA